MSSPSPPRKQPKPRPSGPAFRSPRWMRRPGSTSPSTGPTRSLRTSSRSRAAAARCCAKRSWRRRPPSWSSLPTNRNGSTRSAASPADRGRAVRPHPTRRAVEHAAAEVGCPASAALRRTSEGHPFVTDGGHLILDLALGRIPEPQALAARLAEIPGVVEHGLFIGLVRRAVIAGPHGIRVEEA